MQEHEGVHIRLARMRVEGMEDVSPDLALRGNRVMLLRPAPSAACEPEYARPSAAAPPQQRWDTPTVPSGLITCIVF